MMEGKYFYIKSRMNGLVLDCRGGQADPGTDVITYDQKDYGDADNQLWFEDHSYGVIRSKQNPACCLTINDDNTLVVDYVRKGDNSQRWNPINEYIQSRDGSNRCLDIAQQNEDRGARICAWEYHGEANQQWQYEHPVGRCFFIKSLMHGKVLDVRGGNPEPGGEVIMYDQGDEQANQLWYEDQRGFIRSKINDFALDSSDGDLCLNPFDWGNNDQCWVLDDDRIVKKKEPNLCLDIKRSNDDNGARLCEWEYRGSQNQRWQIDYV